MQVARSRLGWLLVAAYLLAVVAAYFDAVAKRGTFLYDLALQLLAIPYILVVGRWLLREPTFAVSIDDPLGLAAAVLFCSGLLLLCGAAIESGVRKALRRRRGRT